MLICIFLILYILTVILSLRTIRSMKIIDLYMFLVLGIVLVFIACMRPSYMPDYENYEYAVKYGSDRFEPMFYVIRKLTMIFTDSHYFLFFVYSFLGCLIMIYTIIRDSYRPWLSFLLWISVYFILHEMIQMRQAVAISIMIFSIKYIYIRDCKKYLLLWLIALSFHYSSIMFFPMYFLSSKKTYSKFYILLLIIGNVLVALNLDFSNIVKILNIGALNELFYIKTHDVEPFPPIYFNIRHIIQIFIALFFWFQIGKIRNRYNYAVLYLKFYTIGLFFYMLFYSIPDIADRLSTIFITTEVMLLPLVCMLMRPQIIANIIVILIAIKYFISSYSNYLLP